MQIIPDSHLDHGLKQDHVDFLMKEFGDRTDFFIETVELPPELSDLQNELYGPRVGDEPVTEDEVHYAVRGDRKGKSRMIAKPSRPTRFMTVIAGPSEGYDGIVLYTAYGGFSAEREPFGAPPEALAASEKFWSEHALASEEESMERPTQVRFVSLLQHSITLRLPDNTDMTVKPSGAVARVVSRVGESRTFTDIPLPVLPPLDVGTIEGLPESEDGVIYLVSGMVAGHEQVVNIREDVMAPATGPDDGAIRKGGHIVAVTQLRAAAW